MDANTKQKTLTGVLTALLLGAAFVGVVPTASAAHATPGANLADAFLDAGDFTSTTFAGTTKTVARVLIPADGNIRFNTTYDVTFTNISQGSGPSGYGYGPASQTTGMRLVTPLGFVMPNPRDAVPDEAHLGKFNVTFPSTMFNVTGFWLLEDGAGVDIVTFLVQPENSLTVTLSQTSFPYSPANVTFVVTVSPLAAGQTATLEGRGIPTNTQVTGPTGQYVFSGGLPEAGTFTIYANRSLDGDTIPEMTGTTTYTVTSSPLTVTNVDVSPKAGFDKPGKWNFTYPNGTAVFCPDVTNNCAGGLKIVNYNLSVNFSYGTLYANSSTTSPTLCLWTVNQGCASAPAGIVGWNPVWTFDTSGADLGVFTFRPDATWPAGPYSFSLTVNAAGAADSLVEYTTSWAFTPATPADINLDLMGKATGHPGPLTSQTLSNLSVIENVTNTGPAGSYTLYLNITGNNQAEHPTQSVTTAGRNVIDNFAAANISISGDVILHDTLASGTFSYNPTTGMAVLQGVTPTRHGGNVVISVTWKGQTTTLTLPIVNGAVMTAVPTELVVDTTSSVTFTVRDDFGNPVPDAQILIWLKPSGSASSCSFLCGATAINGTGAPGAGQNGQYTLTLKPASIGKYIAYTQIGREAQGTSSDTRRFAYLELNVVPAHDVNTTVTPATAMASVTTAYMVNATIPDGRSLGSTAIFYLLSETQRADQIANLSLTTGVAPATTCSAGQVSTPAGCVAVSSQTNAAGGVTNYFFNATLPAGTWYLYTCGNAAGSPAPAAGCTDARHDNNQSVPTITVSPFRAVFNPAQIANNPNIQSNTTVNVTVTDVQGTPWNGTLVLNSAKSTGTLSCAVASGTCTPGAAVTSFSVPIVNGNGSFVATGLGVGDVVFNFDPLALGGNAPADNPVDAAFRVVGPNVTVTPDRIPIGRAATITVNVRSLNGTPMTNLSVRMCGTPIGGNDTNPACTGSVQTDESGNALMGVNPLSTGTLTLYVNNVTAGKTVLVYAGLFISFVPSSPNAGDTVTGTVAQVGNTGGEPGVTVTVTRNGTAVSGFPQTTGTNGQFVLSNVQAGTYTVVASKPGFQNQTETLVVGSRQTQDNNTARFELSNLVAPSSAAVGQPMTVTADVRNVGNADGTATVLLLVNGQVRDTRSVPVTAGGQETIAFDFTPAQGGSLRVTVKLATGETLAEKTVTVTQQTTTTTTQQTTTTTTTTTTQVTTTPTPTPRVPGFEVVALLGALAVAMLVLRRRN